MSLILLLPQEYEAWFRYDLEFKSLFPLNSIIEVDFYTQYLVQCLDCVNEKACKHRLSHRFIGTAHF